MINNTLIIIIISFFNDLILFSVFKSGSYVIVLGFGFYRSPTTCLGYPYIIL